MLSFRQGAAALTRVRHTLFSLLFCRLHLLIVLLIVLLTFYITRENCVNCVWCIECHNVWRNVVCE